MKDPVKIVLVGLPGSGKSTFGKKLALQLHFEFIDLDHLIEKETHQKIPHIFQSVGEGGFRELETIYLKQVLSREAGFVLSTGGGTPCFNDNMDLINKHAISVYLDVALSELHSRLKTDVTGKRPMFAGLDEAEMILKLKNLYAQRVLFYDQAKIKLSGEDISTELLISELMVFFRS
ncbi:shikimate kinase [Rhodonellum sp.]|uniref:shikimate kinase n=1 Tax=Rhodonellum sp. TaxID=2231180 RepID=UPI002717FC35|nr:shikimate kinase [Rhodonellum sp.]MDO9551853.1 shikimate kinase [Rhodonellum sp.]